MTHENGSPKVTLLSWTQSPVETIYRIWESSRGQRSLNEIDKDIYLGNPRVYEIFKQVIDSKLPVSENLSFVFLLENVSISFREQMVRHRIGVKAGPLLGIDMIPDLADSTWWSQTMRVLDMGAFADEKRYRVPDGLTPEQEDEFHVAMKVSQDAYNRLVKAGIPNQEAREVIPLGATHRITWSLNLSALQHIVGKRGCQIAQLGLWRPVIEGMVDEMSSKVHEYFRTLISPPCMKGDKYTGCLFKIENDRRIDGTDQYPPCTLCVGQDHDNRTEAVPANQRVAFMESFHRYRALWQRDPLTGERLK